MAGFRWLEEHLHRHWRHSAGLLGNHGTNVYLWKESTHVDGEKELHGEVLTFESS